MLRDRVPDSRAGRIESLSLAADPTPLTGWRRFAGAARRVARTLPSSSRARGRRVAARRRRSRSATSAGASRCKGSAWSSHDARASSAIARCRELKLTVSGLDGVAAGLAEGAPPEAVTALRWPDPAPGLDRLVRKPGRAAALDADRRRSRLARASGAAALARGRPRPAAPRRPGRAHRSAARGSGAASPSRSKGASTAATTRASTARVALALPRRRLAARRRCRLAPGSFEAELEKLGNFQATGCAASCGSWAIGSSCARAPHRCARAAAHGLRRRRPLAHRHRSLPPRRRLEDGSASEILSDLSLDGSTLRGVASFDASLDGEVRAGLPILAAHARDRST